MHTPFYDEHTIPIIFTVFAELKSPISCFYLFTELESSNNEVFPVSTVSTLELPFVADNYNLDLSLGEPTIE